MTLSSLRAALAAGLGLVLAPLGSSASAIEPLGALYGLRLGAPLDEQLRTCPVDAQGRPSRERAQPCWLAPQRISDGLVTERVYLPPAVYAEAGLLEVRTIRVAAGRVVEVELDGMQAELARLSRSLRQRKGPPDETETYERDSRPFGLGQVKAHTWRDAQVTLFFDERSQSGHPRLRAFVNDWAAKAAR